MVLLSLFLLAGFDQAINKKKNQTIGKRVRIGLTEKEYRNLTRGYNFWAKEQDAEQKWKGKKEKPQLHLARH